MKGELVKILDLMHANAWPFANDDVCTDEHKYRCNLNTFECMCMCSCR